MIEFGIFIVLLFLGFVFGRINETRHFRELDRRETELVGVKTASTKSVPDGYQSSQFVSGNVVISIDYFKRIAAAFRAIFGGKIESYSSLVERARREAVLRMKQEARDSGCNYIANVRLETASVYKNAQSGIGSLEVFAYGTALK